tara:strand:- start:1059 stop:1433 length:375 start_codon:yes stop_codon:yes gene_type:complete
MSSSIIRGDIMPTITLEECVNETDTKGNWVELDDTALVGMFSSVIVQNQEEELGSEFAFHRVRDEEYYQEKFPGFADEVYTILAKEQVRLDQEREKISNEVDKMENEIVDLERNINDLAIAMGK